MSLDVKMVKEEGANSRGPRLRCHSGLHPKFVDPLVQFPYFLVHAAKQYLPDRQDMGVARRFGVTTKLITKKAFSRFFRCCCFGVAQSFPS